MIYITKMRPLDFDIHGTFIDDPGSFNNALEKAGNNVVVCIMYAGSPFQKIVAYEAGDESKYELDYRTRGARFYMMPPDKLVLE